MLLPKGTDDHAALGLALLSFTAGSADAIAFLALSGVFTSAMSGNTVLLGLAVGQGHFGAALHSFVALLGYITGVAMASLSFAKFGRGCGRALGLEALFLAAFVTLWLFTDTPARSPVLCGLIGLSAIAMGLQGGVGRALGVPGIMTVIFTSTYTALIGSLVERAQAGERPLLTSLAARQVAALAAYFGGAVIGGVIAAHQLRIAPLLPLASIVTLLAGLRFHIIRLQS